MRFKHPKICTKWINNGASKSGYREGKNCSNHHPIVCRESLNNRTCPNLTNNQKCTKGYHLRGTVAPTNQGQQSQKQRSNQYGVSTSPANEVLQTSTDWPQLQSVQQQQQQLTFNPGPSGPLEGRGGAPPSLSRIQQQHSIVDQPLQQTQSFDPFQLAKVITSQLETVISRILERTNPPLPVVTNQPSSQASLHQGGNKTLRELPPIMTIGQLLESMGHTTN